MSMDSVTPTPSPSPISSQSSPPTIPIVFAGIFGTVVLCATLYTADWYFRRHKIGHLHESYGLQKENVGRSEVRGFGLLSETQAIGHFVGQRVRGLRGGLATGRSARRGAEVSGEREETTESDDESLTSSTRSDSRQRRPNLPRIPPQAYRRTQRAITRNADQGGIEQSLPQQSKLVPHYVAANMNWAYQKGYGDAARWLDIESQQMNVGDALKWDQPRDASGWYWDENGANEREKEWDDCEYGAGRSGRGTRKPSRATCWERGDYRRRRMKRSGGQMPPGNIWSKEYGSGRVLGEV